MKSSFKTKLRQLWYPASFRLPEPEFSKEQLDLLEELIQLIQPTMSIEERSAKDERVSMANFLVDLGTGMWRIRRRIESLSKMPKEVSDALYSLESTWESMSDGGVEIVDYIGTIPPKNEVRVVEVREIPNLAREEVIDALKPTILLHGEIIQFGEVVVGCPHVARDSEEVSIVSLNELHEGTDDWHPSENNGGWQITDEPKEEDDRQDETELPPKIEIEAESAPAELQPDEPSEETPPLIDGESVDEPRAEEYADVPDENEPPLIIDNETVETEANLPEKAESDFTLGEALSDAEAMALSGGYDNVEEYTAEIDKQDEPIETPPLVDDESVDEPSGDGYDNISAEDEPQLVNEVEVSPIFDDDEPPELPETEVDAVVKMVEMLDAKPIISEEQPKPKKRGRKPKSEVVLPEPEPINEIDAAAGEWMTKGHGRKRGLKVKTVIEPELPKKRGRKPKAEVDAASEDKPVPKKSGRKKKITEEIQ